jgi:hypothetical protein
MVMKNSPFWDTIPSSPFKINQCLEEHVAYMFRMEEYAKQETSMKQAAIAVLYPRRENSS